MDNRKVQKLMLLARLDVDAIAAYDAAIAKVSEPMVKEKLSEFRVDHQRHVQDLNALITKYGGTAVELTPDFFGLALHGMTAVQSMIGTEGALAAMFGNENLTNATYAIVRKLQWDADDLAVIEKNFADERRHLAWIKMALFKRPWRRAEAQQSA